MSASSQSSLPAIYGQVASEESKRLRPLSRVVEVGCAPHAALQAAGPAPLGLCLAAVRPAPALLSCSSCGVHASALHGAEQRVRMQSDAGDLESAAAELSKAASLLVSIERHILGLQSDGVRCGPAVSQQRRQHGIADVRATGAGPASSRLAAIMRWPSLRPACADLCWACRRTRVPWPTARQSGRRRLPPSSGAWRPWRLPCQPGCTPACPAAAAGSSPQNTPCPARLSLSARPCPKQADTAGPGGL